MACSDVVISFPESLLSFEDPALELGSLARLSPPGYTSADATCHACARLLGWDTRHQARPCLRQAGLSATAGEMPAGRRQGPGRAGVGHCYWEPEVACSYMAGLVTLAPPRDWVQTGREGGRPHPGQRGHLRPGE